MGQGEVCGLGLRVQGLGFRDFRTGSGVKGVGIGLRVQGLGGRDNGKGSVL